MTLLMLTIAGLALFVALASPTASLPNRAVAAMASPSPSPGASASATPYAPSSPMHDPS